MASERTPLVFRPILWTLEVAAKVACRVRGHRWSYEGWGYCTRAFCDEFRRDHVR